MAISMANSIASSGASSMTSFVTSSGTSFMTRSITSSGSSAMAIPSAASSMTIYIEKIHNG